MRCVDEMGRVRGPPTLRLIEHGRGRRSFGEIAVVSLARPPIHLMEHGRLGDSAYGTTAVVFRAARHSREGVPTCHVSDIARIRCRMNARPMLPAAAAILVGKLGESAT